MRLLKADLTCFESYESDESRPKYGILSHRWRDHEVLFQHCQPELSLDRLRSHKGFSKIENFCKQARKDGTDWVWIDTCCIDKSSSAELSEAINSMFRWYRDSMKCYAYLDDCETDLHQSKWFGRGWTLQELIAPRKVSFYNKSWEFLGDKAELKGLISEITGIDEKFLLPNLDLDELYSASIAKRMSWASKRVTTRVEDIAYCLLGIFDINMPLLYGEGTKAFKRLQEEILRLHPEDHSLFAWGTPVERFTGIVVVRDLPVGGGVWRDTPLPSVGPEPLLGLLASSPLDFAFSRYYSPIPWAMSLYKENAFVGFETTQPPAVVGQEIRIDLPRVKTVDFTYQFSEPAVTQIRRGCMAALLCYDERDPYRRLSLALLEWGYYSFARSPELCIGSWKARFDDLRFDTLTWQRSMGVCPERKTKLKHGDVLIGSTLDYRGTFGQVADDHWFEGAGVSTNWERVVRIGGDLCSWYLSLCFEDSSKNFELDKWSIIIGRVDVNSSAPALKAGVLPTFQDPRTLIDDAIPFTQERVFAPPVDSGKLEMEDCIISIYVKREQIAPDGSFIDVVDIDVRRQPATHPPAVVKVQLSDGSNADQSNWQCTTDAALPFRGIPSEGIEALLGSRRH